MRVEPIAPGESPVQTVAGDPPNRQAGKQNRR
jgi:hypothetical protein